MMEQNQARLAELRKVSNEYMDDALRRTEEAIAQSLEEVRDTRMKFRSLSEAQEKKTQAPVNIDIQ
jgi:prefoldin subunit 5